MPAPPVLIPRHHRSCRRLNSFASGCQGHRLEQSGRRLLPEFSLTLSSMPGARMIDIKTAISGMVRTARRCVMFASLLLPGLLITGSAFAEDAPDVVVLCDPSLRKVLVEAGQVWQARSDVPVRVLVGSLVQNAELSRHGARADILVGIGADQMDTAQRLGAIDPATRRVVAQDPTVLAVRGPKMQPMALVSGSNVASLLGDGRLGLVDMAIGKPGSDARAALAATGLWPALEPRSSGAEDTDALVARLNQGAVRAAVLYRSDIMGHPGLSVAATFPVAPLPVVAAMTTNLRSPHAREFLAFLQGDGLETLKRAGLEAP